MKQVFNHFIAILSDRLCTTVVHMFALAFKCLLSLNVFGAFMSLYVSIVRILILCKLLIAASLYIRKHARNQSFYYLVISYCESIGSVPFTSDLLKFKTMEAHSCYIFIVHISSKDCLQFALFVVFHPLRGLWTQNCTTGCCINVFSQGVVCLCG